MPHFYIKQESLSKETSQFSFSSKNPLTPCLIHHGNLSNKVHPTPLLTTVRKI